MRLFDRYIFFGGFRDEQHYKETMAKFHNLIDECFSLMSGLQQPYMSTDIVTDEMLEYDKQQQLRLDEIRENIVTAIGYKS